MLQILLIAAFHLRVDGSPSREAVDRLEKLQKKLKSDSPRPCPDCELRSAGHEEPAWTSCLRKVCPHGFGKYGAAEDQVIAEGFGKPDAAFRLKLRETFKAFLEHRLRSVESVRKAIFEDRKVTKREARRLLGFTRILREARPGPFPPLNSPGLVTPADRKPLTADDRAREDFLVILRNISATDPLSASHEFLTKEKSNLEVASLVARAYDTLKLTTEKIASSGGPSLLTDRMKAEFEGALARSEITPEVYESIKSNLHTARVVEAVVGFEPFDRGQFSISVREAYGDQEPQLARQAELLRHNLQPKERRKGNDPLKDILTKALIKCETADILNRGFAPTQEQIDAFARKLPKIRSDFLNGLKPHLSQESNATLKNFSEHWTPAIAPVASVLRKNFEESLESHRRGLLPTPNEQDVNTDIVLASRVTFMSDLFGELQKDLDRLCVRNQVEPIRDAALVTGGKITIGPLSVSKPPFGEPVTRHEYGHLASGLFQSNKMSQKSRKWYSEVRTCLAGANHEDQVEEDWSDFASDLAEANQAQPCEYIIADAEHFTLKPARNPQTGRVDEHSADLYRILRHEYMHGRDIPKECTSALAQKGEAFEPDCRQMAKAPGASADASSR